MDSQMVEELTRRLPTADLVKIIKGALDCGRRNVPFTESDLLRAMTFGTSAGYVRPSQNRHVERYPLAQRSVVGRTAKTRRAPRRIYRAFGLGGLGVKLAAQEMLRPLGGLGVLAVQFSLIRSSRGRAQ